MPGLFERLRDMLPGRMKKKVPEPREQTPAGGELVPALGTEDVVLHGPTLFSHERAEPAPGMVLPDYAKHEEGHQQYNVGDPVEIDAGMESWVSAVHVLGPPLSAPRRNLPKRLREPDADPGEIAAWHEADLQRREDWEEQQRASNPYFPFRKLEPGQVMVQAGTQGRVLDVGEQTVAVRLPPPRVQMTDDALTNKEWNYLLKRLHREWFGFGFLKQNAPPLKLESERVWAKRLPIVVTSADMRRAVYDVTRRVAEFFRSLFDNMGTAAALWWATSSVNGMTPEQIEQFQVLADEYEHEGAWFGSAPAPKQRVSLADFDDVLPKVSGYGGYSLDGQLYFVGTTWNDIDIAAQAEGIPLDNVYELVNVPMLTWLKLEGLNESEDATGTDLAEPYRGRNIEDIDDDYDDDDPYEWAQTQDPDDDGSYYGSVRITAADVYELKPSERKTVERVVEGPSRSYVRDPEMGPELGRTLFDPAGDVQDWPIAEAEWMEHEEYGREPGMRQFWQRQWPERDTYDSDFNLESQELKMSHPAVGAENIRRVLNEATPEEVEVYQYWYDIAREQAKMIAAESGHPFDVVAAVLAVMSPGPPWERVVQAARRLCLGQSIKGLGGLYPVGVYKAMRALKTGDPKEALTGNIPKVLPFYKHLTGTGREAVVDRHMWMIWFGRSLDEESLGRLAGSSLQKVVQRETERVADEYGMTTDAVQAITWHLWRSRKGLSRPDDDPQPESWARPSGGGGEPMTPAEWSGAEWRGETPELTSEDVRSGCVRVTEADL